MAIGSPFDLQSTITAGIVSAKARQLGVIPDELRVESFIQTDAAVTVAYLHSLVAGCKGKEGQDDRQFYNYILHHSLILLERLLGRHMECQ